MKLKKKYLIAFIIALLICNGVSTGSSKENPFPFIIRNTGFYLQIKDVSSDVQLVLMNSVISDTTQLQYMTLREFKDRLFFYESLCDYKAVNKFGFAGGYQFSGYMIKRFGRVSRERFLNSPSTQERAMSLACMAYIHYLYYYGYDKYINQEIDGIKITLESLMLGVHFSPTYLNNWLKSGGTINQRDANVSIRLYMSKFESKGDTIKIYELYPQ